MQMIKLNQSVFSGFSKTNLKFLLKVGSICLSAVIAQAAVVPNAFASTELSTKETFSGRVDYTVTGGTLRSNSDDDGACNLNEVSTAQLSGIPSNATIQKAYLYWGGSGETVDNTVSLDNTSLTADKTYTEEWNPDKWYTNGSDWWKDGIYQTDFFQGVKDVTDIVKTKGNGSYDFKDLSVTNTGDQCYLKVTLSALGFGGSL